jgi:anti-sigma regulatory factor (Ser/Thr protein kinase)
MQIPNDPKYAPAAAIYVCEIARTIGMQKQDLESLQKGMIEAINALIGYSFNAGEKGILEVFCERIPEGFKVSLRDKGLPFTAVEAELSVTAGQVDDIPAVAEPLSHLKEYLDEIRLHNLGPEGKELVLVKHLKNKNITDYYAACDLEPYEPSPSAAPIALAADQLKCRGIKGAFGEAVTNHTISQHTVHGFGFRDCGLRLGLIPPKTLFKGMHGKIPYRGSMLVQFLYLQVPSARALKIYAPHHHKNMLAALYKELGVRPHIKQALPAKTKKAAATSIVKIWQVASMSYARMIIDRYGRNIVDELRNKVKEICLEKTEIVNLFLNLSDALTGTYAAQFEKLGFFFAGILPGGFKDGDALILQYLNNVPIDYDAIQVKSAIAGKLLAYVREQDPNL